MKRTRLAVALLLGVAAARTYGADWVVAPELWDRPRTGRAVLEQAAVRQAIDVHMAQPGSQVVIHHGLGPEPLTQAEELRAWLMALAIDGARIRLANDLQPNDPLRIEVVK
jgi:hypothetical protein